MLIESFYKSALNFIQNRQDTFRSAGFMECTVDFYQKYLENNHRPIQVLMIQDDLWEIHHLNGINVVTQKDQIVLNQQESKKLRSFIVNNPRQQASWCYHLNICGIVNAINFSPFETINKTL